MHSISAAGALVCTLLISASAFGQDTQPKKQTDGTTKCTSQTTALDKAKSELAECKKTSSAAKDQSTACKSQNTSVTSATSALKTCQDDAKANTSATQLDVDKVQKQLDKEEKSDFEAELGIGSLIRNGSVTDYSDNSNILAASSLGYATPQYLIGIAMKGPYKNFGRMHHLPSDACQAAQRIREGKSLDGDKLEAADCPDWRQRPWAAFVSLKFSPNTTQTINGYVLGGSYRALHYMNALVGFSLTPVNVPSYGLRITASQYVAAQQKLGNLLNFNPVAMLANSQNAFDGFSLTDSAGKLIYSGTPLEINYRGGVVVGVSIPIDFATFLKGKS